MKLANRIEFFPWEYIAQDSVLLWRVGVKINEKICVGLVLRVRILLLETLNFQEKSGGPNNGFVFSLLGFYREQGNGR